ncbi:ABC-type transport system involved in Fe-S cluster assembly, permease and ATPase component [Balamuthia mandrillaris]
MMSVCGSAAILPPSSAAMTVLTTTSSQASLEDRKALRNRKKRQNRRRAKAGKDLEGCVVVAPPKKKEPAAREEEEGQEGGTKLAPSSHNNPQKKEQKEKKRKKKSNKGREVVSSLRLLLRLCWLLRPELRLMAFATVASITVALMNILSNLYIGTIVGVITASPNLHHSPYHNTTLSSSYPSSFNSTSSSYDPSSFSAAAVADLASAIPTGSLPSLFLPSRENTSFDRYCLLLLLILASHALFYGVKVSLFSIAAEHFSVRLKTSVLDSLLKQEVGFFDKRGIGDLISRLNTDTDTIKDAISSQIAELIMSLLTILGGVLFLLSLSWKLTVVLLCSSPIMGVAMGLQSKFGSAYTEQELEAAAKATDRAEETLSNIRLVHACCREDYHKDKYRMALNLVFELKQRLALMNGMFETLTWFIMNGSMVGCVWYAGKLVGSGDLLTSEMLSYVLFATDVVLYVGYLPQTISQLAKGVGAGKRMFHLLDRKPKHTLLTTSSSPSSIGGSLFSSETEITSPQAVAAATNGLSRSRNSSSTNLNEKKGVKDEEDEEDDVEYTNSNNNSLSSSENENENEDESEEELVGRLAVDARPSSPSPFSSSSLSSSSSPTMLKQQDKIRIPDHEFKGVVEFQDVRFSYPTRKGVRVLSNISFTIPAGTSLGIVGRTGCGKSTLISLLLRFYSVQQGRVLIDGYDLEHLDIKWFRNHVGVVMQNNQLFSGTIADNIRYGRPDATMEEVKEAAKQANIHSFIESLPAQYDTSVGQKGVTFSGGQRQRICIARAILKNPKILLLDEATSALDSHSERLVQEALNRLMVGRTTVVIAHRLNTLNDLDRLLVMNAGQIVEDGAPSDLMSDERSLFRKLLLQSP